MKGLFDMELFGNFGSEWFLALGSILFINLILSGDNAVIIAMASKNLPPEQRKKAIMWGSAGAVILRIVLTFVAAYLLEVPFLQFIGGLALLWIAVNLLKDSNTSGDYGETSSYYEAVKVILFADLIMSLDNVLALAAISQTVPSGKYALITIGLATSIPLVVFGAQMLMKLMDRYPVIIYLGAAILGYAAAEMIVSDKAVGAYVAGFETILTIALTAGVVAVGYYFKSQAAPADA